MAGQFDLPSWLTTQTPWSGSDAFIKGSQAGAAIAANRLRAKALYVDVQQHQQKMDLAERQFATENEASTLKNEVIRTKLANDAADFQTLREWWPAFQSSEGEIDMPVLRDENTMLKVAAAVAEKRSKIGQAAFAELMATPGFDLANPEHQKQYFELLSRYKNIPAKLGPDGVMGPIKVAENLKRLRDEAASKIASRTTRDELAEIDSLRKDLLADSTIDVNDARITDLGERRAVIVAKQSLAEKKLELEKLESASDIAYDDARVQKLRQEINLSERRLLIQEGNLALRKEELGQKGRRLDAREQAGYNNELKALNEEEKAKLKSEEAKEKPDATELDRLRKFYNLKRRALTEKFYGPASTNAPAITPRAGLQAEPERGTNAPPAVTAPNNDARAAEIRASFREGKITKEQALQQLRELGFK